MKILVYVFCLLLFLMPVMAFDREDFLVMTDNKVGIVSSYTQYRVCNPTVKDYVIDGSSKKFSVNFLGNKEQLLSYQFLLLKNVSEEMLVYDYEDVEHSYTCNDLFNYTLAPKHATCYKVGVNGSTEILFDRSFRYGDIGSKTVYWDEYEFVGTRTEDVIKERWVSFSPLGKTFQAGKCYDVRVSGRYRASTEGIHVDNVVDYVDYSFTEYAWWSSSWSNKKMFNITDTSGYSGVRGMKINMSGLAVSSCDEGRIVDSTETVEINHYVIAGDDSTWCYFAFSPDFVANSTSSYYYYYNNTGVGSAGYVGGLLTEGADGTTKYIINFTNVPSNRIIGVIRGVPMHFTNGSNLINFDSGGSGGRWYAIRDDEVTVFGVDTGTGTGGTCNLVHNSSLYMLMNCYNGAKNTSLEVFDLDYRVYQKLFGFTSTANDGIRLGFKASDNGGIKWRSDNAGGYTNDDPHQMNLGVAALGLQAAYWEFDKDHGFYLGWSGFGVNRTRQYVRSAENDDPQMLYFGHTSSWEVSAGQFSLNDTLVWGFDGLEDSNLERQYQTLINLPTYVLGFYAPPPLPPFVVFSPCVACKYRSKIINLSSVGTTGCAYELNDYSLVNYSCGDINLSVSFGLSRLTVYGDSNFSTLTFYSFDEGGLSWGDYFVSLLMLFLAVGLLLAPVLILRVIGFCLIVMAGFMFYAISLYLTAACLLVGVGLLFVKM